MTTTDEQRRPSGDAEGPLAAPVLWPAADTGTGLLLAPDVADGSDGGPDGSPAGPAGPALPVVRWLGPLESIAVGTAGTVAAAGTWEDTVAGLEAATAGRLDGPRVVSTAAEGAPLLPEHSRGWFTRPALRGHRLSRQPETPAAGRDWSTAFRTDRVDADGDTLVIEATDPVAGLTLRTTVERVAGGALRASHELTNIGDDPYVVDGLEVLFPLPDHLTEVLDFTGRHLVERVPQRHTLTDGLWLRESRRGKTGVDAATMVVAGTPGFGTTHGEVVAVHVGWSGNSVLRVERDNATTPTIGGGELLLPGEVVLAKGEQYRTPWVWVVASHAGLDDVAATFHRWLRSQPAHPATQPVTLNVWEAVYFDHDLPRLKRLADLAARVGAERYVLDDGWFRHRRHDRAGLGDWWVDETVWPDGLGPLIDHVHGLGLQFGLWFEPEMINPDSDLYRAHPDWILSTGDRIPQLQRHQLVLDLTRPEVRDYLVERLSAILGAHAIDAVKWDHNRDLLDAGSGTREGAAAVHGQTAAYYELLDELRRRHPNVEWESCAGGGGRVDLGVLSRVQRVWTSDMTDALARQQIQRWTSQLVAPEYLGAHVSATVSHQTGRVMTVDFRAATAMWGAMGIEWDLTSASEEELDRLGAWLSLFKRFRPLLHSGRMVRPECADPSAQLTGVVAADRREALVAVAQLGVPVHNRGLVVPVPGLDPARRYRLERIEPEGPAGQAGSGRAAGDTGDAGFVAEPLGEAPVPGAVLGSVGIRLTARRRPETVTLLRAVAVD